MATFLPDSSNQSRNGDDAVRNGSTATPQAPGDVAVGEQANQAAEGADEQVPGDTASGNSAPGDTASGAQADRPAGATGREAQSANAETPLPLFAPPKALASETEEVLWNENASAVDNYKKLGEALVPLADFYRSSKRGDGLWFAPPDPANQPKPIKKGDDLAPLLVDYLRIRVMKDGKSKGSRIPNVHLNAMLRSEAFLQAFRPVDEMVRQARYLASFEFTRPGYNDGGPGQRILHTGEEAEVSTGRDAIQKFLNVMAFADNADRTNAVAALLTVLLRHLWHGAKPILVVTSTKSHGGKDTVISFACGTTPHVSVLYQTTDWALERSIVGALKNGPEIGVVIVENARLGKGAKLIASGSMERLITDPEPFLFSTGTGAPERRPNNLVLALSTNYGVISEDLMNRALPIHLAPVGNVADRKPDIGNPKLEYLPANCRRIVAEARGMIEKWKQAGKPLDMDVRHPFTDWARTIGGILKVNGFKDFLGNYSQRRTEDDPVRQALALLGAAAPDSWLRPAQWAEVAVKLGLARTLLSDTDRSSDAGCARGMGVILSQHDRETFHVETEDRKLDLRLEKSRKRFDKGEEASTRYCFIVVEISYIAEDAAEDAAERAGHRQQPATGAEVASTEPEQADQEQPAPVAEASTGTPAESAATNQEPASNPPAAESRNDEPAVEPAVAASSAQAPEHVPQL